MSFYISVLYVAIGRLILFLFKIKKNTLKITLYSSGIALLISFLIGIIASHSLINSVGYLFYCLPGVIVAALILLAVEMWGNKKNKKMI